MSTSRPSWKSLLLRHETILLVIVLLEFVFFHFASRFFFTSANVANILRHSVEIGLLALVMTPIILTGGIDLSIGSLMGLCAVAFGMFWQDVGLSIWIAALAAIGVGALGGGLNALLITGFRLPPLIVTLGTFSLFRGLAEALTGGTRSFHGFSESFLALGDGLALGLPVQAWIFAAVAAVVWLLVHRTTFGRSWRAIGFSPEGARYAGLPVPRRIATAYILAGAVAGLAAMIFVSRVSEARANAGVGYELAAITAVVLGGTSIFGGAGSIHGTLLGCAAVAMLANGLKCIRGLANPTELAGLLTGGLLLLALAAGSLAKTWSARRGKSAASLHRPDSDATV
jgi:rhamnose transport system permease protein